LNKGNNQKAPEISVKKAEEDLKSLNIDATSPPKRVERIDVLKAHSESNAKENINFVVVGQQHLF
jgi:hypothetical protein